MIKSEKKCDGYEGALRIGEPAIIILPGGFKARTSPITNYFVNVWGHGRIETMNSIYRF